jgi:hypothetical protein
MLFIYQNVELVQICFCTDADRETSFVSLNLREDVKRILLASVAWSSIRLDMYCESKM